MYLRTGATPLPPSCAASPGCFRQPGGAQLITGEAGNLATVAVVGGWVGGAVGSWLELGVLNLTTQW